MQSCGEACGGCKGSCKIDMTKDEAFKTNSKWIKENMKEPITDKSYHSPRISSEFCDCGTPLSLDLYSRCSFQCSYCVDGDTNILLNFGQGKKRIKIKDIKVGDMLLTYNEKTKELERNKVKKVMKRSSNDYYILKIKGDKLKITGEHPVYTKKGWVAVKDLKVGDEVLWAYSFNNKSSNRMKDNNPMYNKETVKKVINKLKDKYSNEEHPNKGNKRPDLSKFMREHNPSKKPNRRLEIGKRTSKHLTERFKDPKERLKMSEKIKELIESGKHPMGVPEKKIFILNKARKSILKKGFISRGQDLLYKKLKELNINYKPEEPFKYSKGRGGLFFVDAFLPKQNIAIEYDGHSFHDTVDGIARDNRRDEFFLSKGIKTIRIKRKDIFRKDFDLRGLINEI